MAIERSDTSELLTMEHVNGERRLRLPDYLVLAGIGALFVAQLLPVYSKEPFSDIQHVPGWLVTASGWAGAMMGAQPVLLLGWTANLWLLATLLVGLARRVRTALVLCAVTEFAAVVGVWALATFETAEQVIGLEIGAWVWLLGVTLAVGGAALSALGTSHPDVRRAHRFRGRLFGALAVAVLASILLGMPWPVLTLILGGLGIIAIVTVAPARSRVVEGGSFLAIVALGVLLVVLVARNATFDPQSPGLAIPSQGHTSTLLPDGTVLVAGGSDDDFTSRSAAVIFDPASISWHSTGSMSTPRDSHTATLLPDGRVLVAGGDNRTPDGRSKTLGSAEVYDPRTGDWSLTGFMSKRRFLHSAALLLDGRVLVLGGSAFDDTRESPDRQYGRTVETYDPRTGVWASAMRVSPDGSWKDATATLLADGTVLAVNGEGDTELFEPSTGRWHATGSMRLARSDGATTLLADGTVLVAGGLAGELFFGVPTGWVQSAELYDPMSATWRATGSMTARSAGEGVRLADGRVLLVGVGECGPPTRANLYDPATETWELAAPLNARHCSGYTLTVLSDGRVLIVGRTADVFDPVGGSWTRVPSP
jgi:hypothetical protein